MSSTHLEVSGRRGRPLALWVLLGLHGFLGVRGVLGGGQFILDPSGDIIGLSTALLAGTPFRDFLLPGLVLFVALGAAPLAVAYGLLRDRRLAWTASVAVSLFLVAWVVAEGVFVGFGRRLQYPNLVQGVVMLLLTLTPSVRRRYGAGRR